jgi:hypothetical protein
MIDELLESSVLRGLMKLSVATDRINQSVHTNQVAPIEHGLAGTVAEIWILRE